MSLRTGHPPLLYVPHVTLFLLQLLFDPLPSPDQLPLSHVPDKPSWPKTRNDHHAPLTLTWRSGIYRCLSSFKFLRKNSWLVQLCFQTCPLNTMKMSHGKQFAQHLIWIKETVSFYSSFNIGVSGWLFWVHVPRLRSPITLVFCNPGYTIQPLLRCVLRYWCQGTLPRNSAIINWSWSKAPQVILPGIHTKSLSALWERDQLPSQWLIKSFQLWSSASATYPDPLWQHSADPPSLTHTLPKTDGITSKEGSSYSPHTSVSPFRNAAIAE